MSVHGGDLIAAGGAAYVDDRLDEARELWEQAFGELRSAAPAAAARVATLLGELHWGGLGNPSIGRGWLERARRLLDECGPCVEQGYWELARLACDRADPGEVEQSARAALAIATEFRDTGLETRALADLGFALVAQGRFGAGFAHLDEAMAALTTPPTSAAVTTSAEARASERLPTPAARDGHDAFVVSTTCCALLSACDRAGDVERATEWLEVVRRLVLEPAGGRPRMLGAHCQIALGGVMCVVGRWAEAESAIRAALLAGSGATAAQRADAAARLAELEVRRGRLDEATELLAPIEDHPGAGPALAEVLTARGQPEVALRVLLRTDTLLGRDAVRRSVVLLAAVQAALQCERPELAEELAARLRLLTVDTDAPLLVAIADLATGLVTADRGDIEHATALIEAAWNGFTRCDRPLLAAQSCLALAGVARDAATAIAAARAAHAIALRLDASTIRDRSAAMLRALGQSVPRFVGATTLPDLTARESEILDGLRRGDSNTEIARRLFLSPKTVEHHVSRLFVKLGVRTRAEAAALAASQRPSLHHEGWVRPPG